METEEAWDHLWEDLENHWGRSKVSLRQYLEALKGVSPPHAQSSPHKPVRPAPIK